MVDLQWFEVVELEHGRPDVRAQVMKSFE